MKELQQKTPNAGTITQIQAILDPYCLAMVTINPEARVKVLCGPAPAKLLQNGWKSFLVKVQNEANVTAELQVDSPNAQLPIQRFEWYPKDLKEKSITAGQVAIRFLELQLYKNRPLLPNLSGLLLEYAVVQIYSKATYTKSLNAFFSWVEDARQQGNELVGFDALSVEAFISESRRQGQSPFTINVRLSAIKALAGWVLAHPQKFPLPEENRQGLSAIARVGTLATEKMYYKEALSSAQRDQLLAHCTDLYSKTLISLMVYSGLCTVELTRLTVGDIDLADQTAQVLGKGKYTRVGVKLFAPTREVLSLYLASLGQSSLASVKTRCSPASPPARCATGWMLPWSRQA